MSRVLALVLVLLAGCTNLPPPQAAVSACAAGNEASYACQVERYHSVNIQ